MTQTPTTSVWQTLYQVFTTQRTQLLNTWKKRIGETPVLQLREDIDAATAEGMLETFYNLIADQVVLCNDYASLRMRILAEEISAFTPDAAGRLLIALKKAVIDVLFGTEIQNPNTEAFHIETVMDEMLLRILAYCHETRYRAHLRNLQTSETRFRTLIETMNEGFTAIDANDHLIFFNQRMETISGFRKDDMIGRPVGDLYMPESKEILSQQLQRRRLKESSTYQLQIHNKQGNPVPVRVSGAPLHDNQGAYLGSFAVITDISEQVLAEKILRQSKDEIAHLLESEKRRATHFATINRVAQMALSTLDPDEIFRRVVHEVQESFGYQHVSLYVLETNTEQMVMRARAGQYTSNFPEGYRQPVGTGIVGNVVASGNPLLANDVSTDPRRILAFPEESNSNAELCVPIKTGDHILGAIDVLSREKGVFDQTDVHSLQVLADQLAWVIHNARLYQETRELKEFSEQVLQTIPLPLLLVNKDLNVVFANTTYLTYHDLTAQQVLNKPLVQSRPSAYLVTPEGRSVLASVFETGQSSHLKSISVPTGTYRNRVIDLLVTRLETAQGSPLALVVIEDITESVERAYESSLLRQISQTMQGILDSDRLLYAILTCVTAGTGLGFNRAIMLQVDSEKNILEGKMGVGPANQAEASRIWSELALQNPSVEDILVTYDSQKTPTNSTLSRAAEHIHVLLDDPDDVLAKAVRERRTYTVTEEDALSISPALWAALGTHHFVVTPLVVQDRAMGVIVADNLYSGAPITADSVEMLRAFAGHAALALENAGLYRQLEEKIAELERTQEELVQSERLAVIGELSAQIAHEIRNPLAIIGGFARSMQRRPDPERIQTAARVIGEEVGRLEVLLTDILNYTRPRQLTPQPTDLSNLIEEVHHLIAEGLQGRGIHYNQQVDAGLPLVSIDVDQFKQVLINLLKNAYQAMPEGGELAVFLRLRPENQCIEIEIKDTGEGIPLEIQGKLFSPYFTTKTTGTGLGLAISKQIIDRHGGNITLESQKGAGTSVFIRIPQTGVQSEGAPS